MLTLAEVVAATAGTLEGPARAGELAGVTTDSRAASPGTLFVCLRGERFDGHDFIPAAVAQGAAALVVDRLWPGEAPGASVVRVEDTLVAYGRIARAWRRKLGLKVVAVTGSSGKTSTKEMLAAYLGGFFEVARTEANYNNEIGVPLTLLGLRPEHEVAVVEMGMRGLGEIAYLAEIAEPDIGVITNIGTAHIGRLGSRSAIAQAKTELWRHMPAGSLAVFPREDALAAAKLAEWGGRGLTISLVSDEAAVWSDAPQPLAGGQVFVAHWRALGALPAGSARVHVPMWGDHHRANALVAIACGLALGVLPPAEPTIAPAALSGRHVIHEINGVTIVDDTYNANPDSMRAALKAFAEAGGGRAFAALGDMGELGDYAAAGHREVGAYAATLGLAGLVAVGTLAAHYGEGEPRARRFGDVEAACDHLARTLRPGDRLLVKASRSARLETLVACLKARLADEPSRHEEA